MYILLVGSLQRIFHEPYVDISQPEGEWLTLRAKASWFAAESGEILEADARMADNDEDDEEGGCDENKWVRALAKESGSASELSRVRQNAYVQCCSDAINEAWKDATDSSSQGVGPGWSS
jgi:hypothetical protein